MNKELRSINYNLDQLRMKCDHKIDITKQFKTYYQCIYCEGYITDDGIALKENEIEIIKSFK